jgi:TolA-binding protein
MGLNINRGRVKMRKILLGTLCLVLIGCGNLSPRLEPKLEQQIDNQNGKIGQLENNQNGIKNDMLNLRQQSEIQNSRLDKVQQGIANLQSNTSYNGIQILSGPGGLFLGFIGMIIIAYIAIRYRKEAILNYKTADMLAEKVAKSDNLELKAQIFEAAIDSDVEQRVYQLIKKHQQS